jgi:DEAD/DEAH box helicase domain-containing protein
MEAVDESRKRAQRTLTTEFPEAQGESCDADIDAELDAHPARTRPLGRTEVLIELLGQRHPERIAGQLVIPARAARHADFPADLDARIVTALRARGVTRLYSHQREAWDHVSVGQHTVVVTPTSSGKTLCYNLPVLDAVLGGRAKALYLFPTKALAQDQVAEILALNAAGALGVRACTFDGDTPGDARRAVRTHGDIVVSNPDMLHAGILPHHTKWAQFFETVRYVVIDELHTYRGVFGSHMANVLRRLRRICRFYESDPVFIFCSATIANPGELARRLLGEPVAVVAESGAPQGRKVFMVWNPPVLNADLGLRASARSQSTHIAQLAVKLCLKTIVFANSRLEVEVLTKYLKDAFDADPRRPARVAAYRGGYLPTERRDKERKLRAGTLDCVVSTSALELGMDIGALDVCVLNGYPGSVAGALQRFGRAGRRQRSALGVLVASSNLLDQYLARHPEFFLGASPEHARIDPDQLLILMDHIRCAAFELPFRNGESFGGEDLRAALDYLSGEGVVHREGEHWHWIADSYPANSVSLRSVAEGNFVVIDTTDGRRTVIAEVDYSSAAVTLYEGAIYMIQSAPWQVERLDWVGRKAYVRRVHADYYTDAIDYTRLKILAEFASDERERARSAHGEVHVVRRVAGYKKIRYYTHENIGYGNVNLPDHEMHTTAIWWEVRPQALERAFATRQEALDGFLGAAYALHHIAALLSLAEMRDIVRAVGDGNGEWSAVVGADGRANARARDGADFDVSRAQSVFRPTIFLYDNYPGGIGIAAPLFDLRAEVLDRAVDLVEHCTCRDGCPACVGPVLADRGDGHLSPRAATRRVLTLLREQPAAAAQPDTAPIQ